MNQKILDPLLDYVFKKIFGNEKNKGILIDFLNSLEVEAQKEKIVDLRIVSNANEKRFKRDKSSSMDIKAMLDNGNYVNIEVQILPFENMPQRSLYYWSKIYSDQLKQGQDYGELKKTIIVNVLGYNQFTHNKIHSIYSIREKDLREKMLDDLEIHYIELKKIGKSDQQLNDNLQSWLLFLTDPENRKLAEMGKEKEEMGKAINLLEELSKSEEERMIAEDREKFLRDQLSLRIAALKRGKREGHEEGINEGIELGKKEGIIETAKNLLRLGFSTEQIIKATGLTEIEFLDPE